jgi:hypothetical protein
MQEDTFIKKFCEDPLLISALSDADFHFYDFIGMLHILLVKNNKKKFHFSGGDLGNNLRVSKALKVPCKRIDRPFYRDKYQSDIIDERCLDHLVNIPINGHARDLCFSMNEKSITEQNGIPITAKKGGKLFDYPECCVDWFYQSQWKDLEVAYDFQKGCTHYDPHTMAKQMMLQIQIITDEWENVDELVQRHKKIALKHNLKVREKFPFVEHQACDSCVDNRDSPTEKLNKIYAEFAEEKYPDLYNLVMSESKKEIRGISERWEDVP